MADSVLDQLESMTGGRRLGHDLLAIAEKFLAELLLEKMKELAAA